MFDIVKNQFRKKSQTHVPGAVNMQLRLMRNLYCGHRIGADEFQKRSKELTEFLPTFPMGYGVGQALADKFLGTDALLPEPNRSPSVQKKDCLVPPPDGLSVKCSRLTQVDAQPRDGHPPVPPDTAITLAVGRRTNDPNPLSVRAQATRYPTTGVSTFAFTSVSPHLRLSEQADACAAFSSAVASHLDGQVDHAVASLVFPNLRAEVYSAIENAFQFDWYENFRRATSSDTVSTAECFATSLVWHRESLYVANVGLNRVFLAEPGEQLQPLSREQTSECESLARDYRADLGKIRVCDDKASRAISTVPSRYPKQPLVHRIDSAAIAGKTILTLSPGIFETLGAQAIEDIFDRPTLSLSEKASATLAEAHQAGVPGELGIALLPLNKQGFWRTLDAEKDERDVARN